MLKGCCLLLLRRKKIMTREGGSLVLDCEPWVFLLRLFGGNNKDNVMKMLGV